MGRRVGGYLCGWAKILHCSLSEFPNKKFLERKLAGPAAESEGPALFTWRHPEGSWVLLLIPEIQL